MEQSVEQSMEPGFQEQAGLSAQRTFITRMTHTLVVIAPFLYSQLFCRCYLSPPCSTTMLCYATIWTMKAWHKVLPDRVYKRAMGALLSLVAGKICTPVLGAQDLGEEQTHALHRIFNTLGEAVRD